MSHCWLCSVSPGKLWHHQYGLNKMVDRSVILAVSSASIARCKITQHCARRLFSHGISSSRSHVNPVEWLPTSSQRLATLAQGTKKTRLAAAVWSTGLNPLQKARITVKKGALIAVTSLNSCLERNVPTVRAAIILHEWASVSPASTENDHDTQGKW